MMQEIITLENVSKKYLFKGRLEKDSKNYLNSLFKKEEFWAINDVNFSISSGEHIGFLGKNGAGKTILLKIISGIVYPSCGKVTVQKPVSPIFEYGAGFHGEFSAIDNIFLYGSLLGIRKNDIKARLDEIINFSELENFLGLKIKHFSTGMKIRLAFSVACLLRPEILILDEALSVGDQGFVQKVHKKIYELQEIGVTMLICSHSKEILKKFCKRGIVLHKGHLVFDGRLNEAINYYEQEVILQEKCKHSCIFKPN